jgi:hypothetical protein
VGAEALLEGNLELAAEQKWIKIEWSYLVVIWGNH